MIINKRTYKNIPILRWKCRQKGPVKSPHKTFSLLPHSLIPYHQYDVNTLLDTIRFSYDEQHSLEDTKDFISAQGINTDIPIENSQIYEFQNLFSQSFLKLLLIPQIKTKMINSGAFQNDHSVKAIIDFIDDYRSPLENAYSIGISNIEKLVIDYFFHYQSGDYFKRNFLFGTPSQKR